VRLEACDGLWFTCLSHGFYRLTNAHADRQRFQVRIHLTKTRNETRKNKLNQTVTMGKEKCTVLLLPTVLKEISQVWKRKSKSKT